MVKILIDTCVWLDIAEDPQQRKLLGVLKELIKMRRIAILLPETVKVEFDRNKERIVLNSGKSLPSIIKRARQMVDSHGSTDMKDVVIQQLNDFEFKIPSLQFSSQNAVNEVDELFGLSILVPTNDDIKLRASQRAIDKLAPFHKNKNSFNDAVIIETYAECLKGKQSKNARFSFVTHNISDFSKPNGSNKDPHPDFDYLFEGSSTYNINLAEVIQRVSPRLVTQLMIEQEDWEQEPRPLSDILEALDLLWDQIWYNRHHNWLYRIETGEHKIIKNPVPGVYNPNETPLNVYKAARKAARLVEKKRGLKNLGPWNDFEWGMLNGKMSALRWVLGDEWDFLDT